MIIEIQLNKPANVCLIITLMTMILALGLSDTHTNIALFLSRLLLPMAVLFNIFLFCL